MGNVNAPQGDGAKEVCVRLASYASTRGHLQRGVRSAPPDQHIPGDTTTPPAPGAVWIGSGDA